MTSPTTYTALVSAITTLAEDQSSEFAAYIPTAINLAEDRLFRLTDVDYSAVATVTTVIGSSSVAKPADHRVTHNLFMIVGLDRVPLMKKTEAFLLDYWPSAVDKAQPKYYTDLDNSNWMVAPTPDLIYQIRAEYEAKPTPLSPTNASNIISTLFPDLLLYASMSNMCEWMKDTNRKAEWEGKLQEALASVNNEGRRSRMDDNTHVQNLEGGRNTVERNAV